MSVVAYLNAVFSFLSALGLIPVITVVGIIIVMGAFLDVLRK